jgi:NAD(P)-dependent dehydrogenase (short-subunit alcohol dehydrogenase family)
MASRSPVTLPLRAASRAISRVVNPGGSPSEDVLREAVQGRVVLITGSSYGIGEATARRLGAAGAIVLLTARSEDRLHELAGDIVDHGGEAHVHAADLSDPDSVAVMADAVLEQHGHVDVLVNNAGKSIRRSIELSYERFHDFQRTIDINYLGPVRLILQLLPVMRERRQGHIVNVSTLGVRMPPAPRWAAYQASKAAFDVFLRSVAPEARSDGVDTTSIYMPLVHTRMSAPTDELRYVPGMRPDQAAGLICHAIVNRPGTVAPWWLPAAEIATDVARMPLDAAMGLYYRMSDDTPSARGEPGGDDQSEE